MQKNYDVVIIGGGPAGTAAGITARNHGLSCCILDKSQFPRKKLCGGLITQKTLDLITEICKDIRLDGLYNFKSNQVEIKNGSNTLVDFNVEIPLYFTYREEFDHLLLKKFEDLGGDVYQSSIQLSLINTTNRSIHLSAYSIHYTYLIGADGANSSIRKLLDYDYRSSGFCLEQEIAFGQLKDRNPELVSVYFGVIPNGYGWVFPKKEGYTVGVGGPERNSLKMKEQLLLFLNTLGIVTDSAKVKGAFIPYGSFPKRLASDHVLLVGDAAGFVDPVNGEGIYFAILSGQKAIQAILDRDQYDNLEEAYLFKIGLITDIIRQGNIVHKLLFNPFLGPVLCRILKGHHAAAAFFLDNLVSRYNFRYSQFFSLISTYLKEKKSRKDAGKITH
ncbi:MAG: geranylgeranyl reductase family protein [Saprospiraceae bacterium]|nr:geranylgeranyl reductase family protein [Saprospiraceae bacterium]